jgi:WD40 repeat protein
MTRLRAGPSVSWRVAAVVMAATVPGMAAGSSGGVRSNAASVDLLAFEAWSTRSEPWRSFIFVARSDGGGTRRLARAVYIGDFSAPGLAWSPDGGRLAFTDPPTGIAVAELTGGVRRIGRDELFGPAWSPGGHRLAATAATESPAVVTFDPCGRRRRQVARSGDLPTWSPDGHWIAFRDTRVRDGASVVRPNGSGRRLVAHIEHLVGLRWSPRRPELLITTALPMRENRQWLFRRVGIVGVNSGRVRTLLTVRTPRPQERGDAVFYWPFPSWRRTGAES